MAGSVDGSQSSSRDSAAASTNRQPEKGTAPASSRKKTVGAATTNLQPGQEVVAWASTALLDVDAGDAGGAVVPAGVGAAGAWSDTGTYGRLVLNDVRSAGARDSRVNRS